MLIKKKILNKKTSSYKGLTQNAISTWMSTMMATKRKTTNGTLSWEMRKSRTKMMRQRTRKRGGGGRGGHQQRKWLSTRGRGRGRRGRGGGTGRSGFRD